MNPIFYFTTPIYYVNSLPHIGHAYTTVVTDVLNRFHRLLGHETYFLTGTDEHGQKIAESAAKRGVSPQVFVDEMSLHFKKLWPELSIDYDHFIRTTDPEHQKMVQQLLQQLYDQGEIELREYEGLYCVGCERFLDVSELVNGCCVDHQTPPTERKEQNYFFKMSAYQSWLIEFVEQHEDWIYPRRYRNEVLQFLKHPLQDLCISRPKSRLEWGIELPFDSEFVTYVWFDALFNYISGLGWPQDPRFAHFWPHTHHLIGKDILKTHAIYWPCMLKAAGFPLFQKLIVHGHWISGGSKMSKSLGNVVDPLSLRKWVGDDALRYFLLRDMSFGEDANFSDENLLLRYNSDLANNLGNLLSRSLNLSCKSFNHQVPFRSTLEPIDLQLQMVLQEDVKKTIEAVEQFQLHRALEQIALMSDHVNKYIDEMAPWKLAKREEDKPRLGTVLYMALDAVRLIFSLLSPVMPNKTQQALSWFNQDMTELTPAHLTLGFLTEGAPLLSPEPLFPRLDKETLPQAIVKEVKTITPNPVKVIASQKSEISIDAFDTIELKVGQIVASQKVEGANKLLLSSVDLGEEHPRSIVSGIAKFYDPATLIGQKVMVVSNLKPVRLRGILSEGMLLCADHGETLTLLEVPFDIPVGSLIR